MWALTCLNASVVVELLLEKVSGLADLCWAGGNFDEAGGGKHAGEVARVLRLGERDLAVRLQAGGEKKSELGVGLLGGDREGG